MAHRFYVCIECFQISVPVFTYSVKVVSSFTPYRIQKLCDELILHVLDGIQTHSVKVQFFGNPFSPAIQFGNYFRMIQIDIVT